MDKETTNLAEAALEEVEEEEEDIKIMMERIIKKEEIAEEDIEEIVAIVGIAVAEDIVATEEIAVVEEAVETVEIAAAEAEEVATIDPLERKLIRILIIGDFISTIQPFI